MFISQNCPFNPAESKRKGRFLSYCSKYEIKAKCKDIPIEKMRCNNEVFNQTGNTRLCDKRNGKVYVSPRQINNEMNGNLGPFNVTFIVN